MSWTAARPRARTSRALVVGLPLAGLLVMHGLAAHGVTGHAPDHHVATSETTSETTLGAHHQSGDGDLAPAADDHGAHALAALCLALLAAIGVALLVRGRALVPGPPLRSVPAATGAAYARSGDPPDLHRLCVLRC